MYGGPPPLATALPLYAAPTCPVAGETHEMVSGAGIIVMLLQLLVTVLVAEFPDESTTLAVKVNVPDAEGVPVSAPVDEFTVTPGGRLPALIE